MLAAGTLEGASEGGMQTHNRDHGFEEMQELFLLLSSRIYEIPSSLAGDSIMAVPSSYIHPTACPRASSHTPAERRGDNRRAFPLVFDSAPGHLVNT